MALVLKTRVSQGTEGSNPSPYAIFMIRYRSGQTRQAATLLTYVFVGSNPTLTSIYIWLSIQVWLKGDVCKTPTVRFRWFKSNLCHHLSFVPIVSMVRALAP